MSIDNEWGCNYKIIEGDILHSKVNDPTIVEKRGDRIISRSVPVYSSTLGVCGVADVVEFIRVEDGVTLPGRKGHFKPNPVEYKNGSPQSSDYAQPSHSSRGAWIETSKAR